MLDHSYLRKIDLLDNATLRAEFWYYFDRHEDLEMSELYNAMTVLVWLTTHYPSLSHAQ